MELVTHVVHTSVVMQGSILPVTIPPPGTPPGICNCFLTWWSIPHSRARRMRQFPTPGTPHRPQIRCFVFKIDFRAIASTTRRFDKNLPVSAFLEFTERRILHSIKKHGHYIEKENS